MKRTFQWAALTGMAFLLVACSGGKDIKGSGKVQAENRQVSDFDELKVSGNFMVNVVADQSASKVILKTDDNILPYILTEMNQNSLTISAKPGFKLYPTTPIQVTLEVKNLQTVHLNGNTTFVAGGIAGNKFDLNVMGTGTSVLKGKLNSLNIDVNGAAQVNTQDLMAENVDVKIHGVAQTSVAVNKKLDVFIQGTGRVTYFGEPPIINQEIYGGGKIIRGAGD